MIERKLTETKQQLRQVSICMAIFAPLIVCGFVWMVIVDGILKAIVMYTWFCIILVPVLVAIYRRHCRRIANLTEMLATAIDGDNF